MNGEIEGVRGNEVVKENKVEIGREEERARKREDEWRDRGSERERGCERDKVEIGREEERKRERDLR